MRVSPWFRRLLRQSARSVHRAASRLGTAGGALAERLAYRPREAAVVAFLAAGLFGGLAVERWRARYPAVADRLEAEPVRLTSGAWAEREPRPRLRSPALRCDDPGAGRGPGRRGDPGAVERRFDLNEVTPAELAHVTGISWRLAARIVAAREALEAGGADIPSEPAGGRRISGPARPPAPAFVSPQEPNTPAPEAPAFADSDAPSTEPLEPTPDRGSP